MHSKINENQNIKINEKYPQKRKYIHSKILETELNNLE